MPPTVALSLYDCVSGVYDLCPACLLTLAVLTLFADSAARYKRAFSRRACAEASETKPLSCHNPMSETLGILERSGNLRTANSIH